VRRLLLDQSVPRGLRLLLTGFDIRTANEMGWSAVSNGELLTRAEVDGFSILVTSDQNLRFQQSLAGRQIAVVVLSTNHWDTIRPDARRIADACRTVKPGGYVVVQFSQPPRRGPGKKDKSDVIENKNLNKLMVLQERIELSTSPLPRECSTTELLQHLKAHRPRFEEEALGFLP
jgi:hypothetical protein